MRFDMIEKLRKSWIQYDPYNDQVYLKQLYTSDLESVVGQLYHLSKSMRYTKIPALP